MIFHPKDMVNQKGFQVNEPDKVMQRYIRKPLLVNGLKHDLRIYVLIANVDPLIAFINEEGLARFCTDKYEVPTAENRNRDRASHLTNYSLNKNSPNFIHTEELIEANQGTKQTLSSYWKALENMGMDPKKVRGEIIRLNQELLKALKPYLLYFQKCTFPRSEPGKYFHVLGVDILLDSKGQPWLLEINSNPSMNVDSTIKEPPACPPITNNPAKHRPEMRTRFLPSAVDLHVKSMALGHAVRLAKKGIEKIYDYEEYDSYTQIFGPDVEAELFPDKSLLDGLYALFLELSGPRFFPALSLIKYCRIGKVLKDLGPRNLNRVDIEVCFKKTLEFHEQMDLYAFFDSMDLILNKIFDVEKEAKLCKLDKLQKLVNRFEGMKKPLFYF